MYTTPGRRYLAYVMCSFYTKLVCLYLSQGCVLVQGNELCVGEFMLSGSRQWTPVVGSPCLLNQGQWTFHLGSPENDPIDFSTFGY